LGRGAKKNAVFRTAPQPTERLEEAKKAPTTAGLFNENEACVDEGNRRRPRARLNNNTATAMGQ